MWDAIPESRRSTPGYAWADALRLDLKVVHGVDDVIYDLVKKTFTVFVDLRRTDAQDIDIVEQMLLTIIKKKTHGRRS